MAPGQRKGSGNNLDTMNRSNKGHYQTVLVENFSNLTPKDVELREAYGIDLISKYTKDNKKMLWLEEKKSKQTSLGRNEVFYVKKGTYNIGKLMIRYRTDFDNKTHMTFVYQVRNLLPEHHDRDTRRRKKEKTRSRGTY